MKWISIMSAGSGAAQWICCSSVWDERGCVTNLHLKHSLITGPRSVWWGSHSFQLRHRLDRRWKSFSRKRKERWVWYLAFFSVILHPLMPKFCSPRRWRPHQCLSCVSDVTFLGLYVFDLYARLNWTRKKILLAFWLRPAHCNRSQKSHLDASCVRVWCG